MKTVEMICMVLLIISGILWGLMGLFNFDLLECVVGNNWFSRLIAFFFGVAAVVVALEWRRRKRRA